MGQKVNPHGMRVGIIRDWESQRHAEKEWECWLYLRRLKGIGRKKFVRIGDEAVRRYKQYRRGIMQRPKRNLLVLLNGTVFAV